MPQPCHDKHLLLQADLDGELDAAAAASLASHVQTCPGCTALQAELAAQHTMLRTGLTRHAAPTALRTRILAASRPASRPVRRPAFGWSHGAAFATGLAVAASVALFVLTPAPGSTADEAIAAAHIRALQPGHLVDVGSSDQHTLKPWFDGRLDYAPPVKDTAAQGFPLIGARLDYLAGRPIAALVYGHDKHLIDVFIWPGDHPGADATVQGYNIRAWTQNGMIFRAVSDLGPTDLDRFVHLLR